MDEIFNLDQGRHCLIVNEPSTTREQTSFPSSMVDFPLIHYRPNNTDLNRRCYPHPHANQYQQFTCLVLNYLQSNDAPTSIEPAEFSENMEGKLERYDSFITAEDAPDAFNEVGLHGPAIAMVKIQIGMIKKPILNNTSYLYNIECVAWTCGEDNYPLWLPNKHQDNNIIGSIISLDWRSVPGRHDPAVFEECKQTSAQEAWRLLRYASVRDYDDFGVRRPQSEDTYWLNRLGRPRKMAIPAVVTSRSGPLTTKQLEW